MPSREPTALAAGFVAHLRLAPLAQYQQTQFTQTTRHCDLIRTLVYLRCAARFDRAEVLYMVSSCRFEIEDQAKISDKHDRWEHGHGRQGRYEGGHAQPTTDKTVDRAADPAY